MSKIRFGSNKSGATASDYEGLQRAIERALAKNAPPPDDRPLWIANIPLLKMKAFESKDPVLFLHAINHLKKLYPNLVINIYKIEEVSLDELVSKRDSTET